MDVNEIVKRKSPQLITQKEMEYVVESYMKEKKGVSVDVNILKGIGNHPLRNAFISRQLSILNEAFDIASKHFCKN